MFRSFFALPHDKPELSPDKRSLYRLLLSALRSITVFQIMVGVGIYVIARLGERGYLDQSENIEFLYLVAAINLLDSLLHLPLYSLLKREKLELVAILMTFINGSLSAAQILLWQEINWFPIILVVSAVAVFAVVRGLSMRSRIIIFLIGALQVAAIFYLDTQITYPRLSTSNLTSNAALAIYIIFTVTMLAIGIFSGMVDFKTISRRLVTIFSTATIITVIAMISIGSLANYIDSRKRAFERLEIISNLKQTQIDQVLTNLKNQARQPISNQVVAQRIQYLLASNPEDLSYQINLDLVRFYLSGLQQQIPGSTILILNAQGKVLVSTNRSIEQDDFSQFDFLQTAQTNLPFVIQPGFPGATEPNALLVLSPLRSENNFLGVVVLQTDFREINAIAQINPGVNETIETYLIAQAGDAFIPITTIREDAKTLNIYPAQQVLAAKLGQGTGIYPNYAERTVLGHYLWLPDLQAVLVSEIDQQEVLANVVNSLYVNFSIGMVMILLTLIVVYISTLPISRPIQEFAEKANALANGQLSTRITFSREDEIGALATSFNAMASELESVVRNLETKVEERTKDLQKQANYMRIASEVARDATMTQDPDELLNRAAQLILDRFNFYHTGLFLIDSDREFAVLRASPTEAGRKMLESGHKLRLGQAGIVGYVAATGIPRIALDTGHDSAYFNNPFLPNTRSEIAIPLKLDDKVIGVLDVQSTQPEAFTQDDISILQTMADQLALAIQRVDLVKNMQRNFEELENTYKTFTADSWQKFSQEPNFHPGYQFDGVKITPLASFPVEMQGPLSRGRITIIPPEHEGAGAIVAAPLKLRDQAIGVLTLHFQTETVEQDALNLIEDIAGRLAVALENARLYAETQNLVQRERAVSEISSRITTSFNVENILRTTVMEIGKMLPEAEVIVQLDQNKE